jgi:TfoX/Sxy family transcriptional regulator of competence genes
MAFDERLAERIRALLGEHPGLREQKMFGGIAFMVDGKMCVGIVGDDLMARVGPDAYQTALAQKHAREMDFTGRPMKGFVFVDSQGIKTKAALERWVDLALEFAESLPK